MFEIYLTTVIDLFSRKVFDYSMDDHIKITLLNDALLMVIKRSGSSSGFTMV